VLAELRRIQQERAVAPRTLAVLADPVVSADDPRLEGHRPPAPVRDDGLRRLPNTADEAAAILSLVAPADRYAALGFDAGLSALRSGAFGRHRIVHLAVHGEIDETHPERSRLVLSRYLTDGRAVPGELRLADIYGLEMPAELVVLSACRSALGKEVQGEGLVGLTRGFFYAGASRLVVSLWEVNDRATSELMRFFYEAMLVDGLAPAAALRAAQDRLRAEPGWASPFYWAGFVLQGDWR
jgi:CHAT domain-containing protein